MLKKIKEKSEIITPKPEDINFNEQFEKRPHRIYPDKIIDGRLTTRGMVKDFFKYYRFRCFGNFEKINYYKKRQLFQTHHCLIDPKEYKNI